MSWYRTYFDDAYFQLHDSLFEESASRSEVGAMRDLLGLPHGARILDVPCGWGRHTALFAEAGLDAFGADLSVPLLLRAPRRMHESGRVRYAAADVRYLPFADASFDALATGPRLRSQGACTPAPHRDRDRRASEGRGLR